MVIVESANHSFYDHVVSITVPKSRESSIVDYSAGTLDVNHPAIFQYLSYELFVVLLRSSKRDDPKALLSLVRLYLHVSLCKPERLLLV